MKISVFFVAEISANLNEDRQLTTGSEENGGNHATDEKEIAKTPHHANGSDAAPSTAPGETDTSV